MLALAAVAVAVALAIGGAGYWWLSGSDQPAKPPAAAVPKVTPPVAVAEVDGGQRPLLMAGKKTLFQRVLSKPGAKLRQRCRQRARQSSAGVFRALCVSAQGRRRQPMAARRRRHRWAQRRLVAGRPGQRLEAKPGAQVHRTLRPGAGDVLGANPAKWKSCWPTPPLPKACWPRRRTTATTNGQVLALEPAASAVPQKPVLPAADLRFQRELRRQRPAGAVAQRRVHRPWQQRGRQARDRADQRQCRCLPHGGGAGSRHHRVDAAVYRPDP